MAHILVTLYKCGPYRERFVMWKILKPKRNGKCNLIRAQSGLSN